MSGSPTNQEFSSFMAGSWGRLIRIASLMSANSRDAEDLLQAALMKTLGHWSSIRGDPIAYTRTAMIRQRTDWWRRRSNREIPVEVIEDVPAAADSTSDAVILHDEVVRLVRALPPRERAAIVLRYLEDLTEADTAEAMGVTVGTVKTSTARAMRKLRTAVNSPTRSHDRQGTHYGPGAH